ncbi:MAG: RNA polymerase sigma factor [Neorhizobium sp.]|nr:RNA polymerase sigma factor [Neorhizobium sp.]
MTQQTPSADIRRDLVALLPRLRRFALTLTGSEPDADELVRESCGHAIQKSHHWKGEGRLESWLFSLIRSTWTDGSRNRRRGTAGSQEQGGASSAEAAVPQEHSLLSMPEGCASAFLLRELEGFSYAEGAAILNMTVEAFAGRLCSARLRLAAIDVDMAERRA